MSKKLPALHTLHPVLPILLGASLLLSLAMGLRQSLGLFMPAITREVGVSVADFTLAIALQNLVWGLLQPVAGAWVARIGFRRIMLAGAALYLLALLVLAQARSLGSVMLGAGLLVGAAMACTGSAIGMAVAARSVSAASRSMVLGLVSAAGSLGALVAAPLGQGLLQAWGWRAGVLGFAVLALLMLPAAWLAGRTDRQPLPPASTGADGQALPDGLDGIGAAQAVLAALRTPPFVVMAAAYFVCGMQLVFITTHLPAYLAVCGQSPMLGAQALGLIGGFNVLGSLFFGWAGGRYNKGVLLGAIYICRSIVLAAYFIAPPTPETTWVFAGLMGFLWLGVAPLVSGAVAQMFGLRWQAMIQGLAFFSHQMGSFLGAYGGGVLYDRLGSYDLAWRVGVALGLGAGLVQVLAALARPPGRPPHQRPGPQPGQPPRRQTWGSASPPSAMPSSATPATP